MSGRNKILLFFGIFYFIFAILLYFGLKGHLKSKFSTDNLREMIIGKSIFRDTTTDLCKYQIIGDPKEVGNYVKISFSCIGGKEAKSTLSLSAIEDKTVEGFIREYARIIGFDEKLVYQDNLVCYLDGKILTNEMKGVLIRPTSSLDCSEIDKL